MLPKPLWIAFALYIPLGFINARGSACGQDRNSAVVQHIHAYNTYINIMVTYIYI